MSKSWTTDDARHTYAIANWGEGYFDVGVDGAILVKPRAADGPAVSLPAVVEAARALGSRMPLLVRFGDILNDRRARLQAAFAKVMADWDYAGGYTSIYPIKVNQQKNVAGELASGGGDGFGLEAGSKPELMAVLALARRGSVVICNGYKDREYIRLALIGRKLGLEIFIVIEKPSELRYVIEEAKSLGVEPLLGVRMRLKSLGAGKWQNSGGDKAKFGLTP
ncbi:MAG: arginine decarboxylase, partial [Dokdonella sp.]